MLGFFFVHPFLSRDDSSFNHLLRRLKQDNSKVVASACKDIFCVISSNQLVGQSRQLVRQLGAVGWIGQLLPSAKMTFASSHLVTRHLGDTKQPPRSEETPERHREDTRETSGALEWDTAVGFLCKDDSCFSPTHPLRRPPDSLHLTLAFNMIDVRPWFLEGLVTWNYFMSTKLIDYLLVFSILSLFKIPNVLWSSVRVSYKNCLCNSMNPISNIHGDIGRINGSKFWQDFFDPSGP